MGWIYLTALLVSSGCMLLLDWRYSLFFWHRPLAATTVTVLGVAFLLTWDYLGIGLGVFFRGEGEIATGILLSPEMPIEEPVFLLLLVLCTMLLYTGSVRLLSRRSKRDAT